MVKAIKYSSYREQEIIVTLKPKDYNATPNLKAAQKLYDYHQKNQDKLNREIRAAPTSKLYPWMTVIGFPIEYLNDIKEENKVDHRYYLAKIAGWKTTEQRPTCNIIKELGKCGNVEVESLRILKLFGLCPKEYEDTA